MPLSTAVKEAALTFPPAAHNRRSPVLVSATKLSPMSTTKILCCPSAACLSIYDGVNAGLGLASDLHVDRLWRRLKGVGHEIFDFSFFHESVSPGLLSILLGSFDHFDFFRKFAEIIANESAVSTTPAINCSAVSTTSLTN